MEEEVDLHFTSTIQFDATSASALPLEAFNLPTGALIATGDAQMPYAYIAEVTLDADHEQVAVTVREFNKQANEAGKCRLGRLFLDYLDTVAVLGVNPYADPFEERNFGTHIAEVVYEATGL